MKHIAVSLIVLAALLALTFTAQPIASEAQQAAAPKFALLEFMKIEPGKTAEYRKIEREVWMPIHRERVKMGLIKSWSLWSMRYPGGTAREYDTIALTTFDKFADADKAYPPELFAKVYPKTTSEALIARTEAARKMIRTEYVTMLDSTQLTSPPLPPGTLAYIGYMKTESAGRYTNLERQYWKPIHQERANRGILRSWALYQVRFPGGTGREYNFFTIQLYDKFEHLETQYPEGIWEKMHPTAKEAEIGDRTNTVRKMVRTDLLSLVEQVP